MEITRGQINEVPVTVTEKTTIDNPVYLFEFKRKLTNEKFYCIAENTSTSTQRYDLFLIEETDDPDPIDGQVKLDKGDYSYTIYQQASTTNLDPALTTPAEFDPYVEIGLLTVYGTSTANTEYDGAPNTNTAYAP